MRGKEAAEVKTSKADDDVDQIKRMEEKEKRRIKEEKERGIP